MAKINQSTIIQILDAIGGPGNVAQSGNCMTRLRLTLNNTQLADKIAIKKIEGVLGVIESDEQFQIVLGPGKAQTAAELMQKYLDEHVPGSEPDSRSLKEIAADQKQHLKEKQTNPVQRFLAKFATIFTPLIPGFIGVGLLLGFATLFESLWVTGNPSPNGT
ncbi:PTS transporter subunit EIIB, partial [Morganella morganii]